MIGYSKNLPSVYTIRGLRAAQGFVFLDPLSATAWLAEQGLSVSEHVRIEAAEVIYYGGALRSKTSEDLQKEKLDKNLLAELQ